MVTHNCLKKLQTSISFDKIKLIESQIMGKFQFSSNIDTIDTSLLMAGTKVMKIFNNKYSYGYI